MVELSAGNFLAAELQPQRGLVDYAEVWSRAFSSGDGLATHAVRHPEFHFQSVQFGYPPGFGMGGALGPGGKTVWFELASAPEPQMPRTSRAVASDPRTGGTARGGSWVRKPDAGMRAWRRTP
ncbi:hypothetical protein [Streptomyces sp. NPDC001948]